VKQLSIFLPLLMILTLLQGCFGGGGSAAVSTTNTVRLVNGTGSTLSMVTAGSQLATAVAPGTASANTTITSGTYPIALVASGVPSAETNFSFSATVAYTMVAYTSDQSLHLVQFIDNEPAPLAGDGQIRIADLSADAGNLDVYMAPVSSALSDTYSPTTASPALQAATLLAQNVSGTTLYNEVLANNYHVWVTGAGNITDLRLDIPSVTIANQQILTLVLTSTTGGGLVNGLFVTQQGAVQAQTNTNARIRVAANTSSAITTATAGAAVVNLIGSQPFNNAVGSYVLVPAGSTTITTNGTPACTPVTTPGEDMTILVTGAYACNPLVDDNTRPTSGYAKLRLVNGVSGAYSLAYNGVQVAQNIGFGTASVPTLNNQGIVNSGISASLVASPTGITLISPVNLNSQGVYSLFLLGTSNPLIQDH
jgi:hypothetical protein